MTNSSSSPWWKAPAPLISTEWFRNAKAHQDNLTKPRGSLGRLEDIAASLCAIQQTINPSADNVGIYIFAGDHGIVQEGVSAYPQIVTVEMLKNFVAGGAAISVMAKTLNASLDVINTGTLAPGAQLEGVIQRPIAEGTSNFLTTEAMSEEQLIQALEIGRDMADTAKDREQHLFIGGEMGIGNSTAAAAIITHITRHEARQVAGRGTGLNDQTLEHKINVIEAALNKHGRSMNTPEDILRCVGGFEIAALAGAYIRAAQQGIAVMVDGYICTAAALCALHMNRSIAAYLIYSHQSAEFGHPAALASLDARPILNLNMRLGEGSGAAMAVPIIRMACELHNQMATFEQAEVSDKL